MPKTRDLILTKSTVGISLKILILGCGSIGSRHARNLKSLGVNEIVLCDPDPSRLDSLGKKIGTNLLYKNYKDAVKKNSNVTAALICTPTIDHVEPAIYFARKKVNLFIEKPLSNNLNKIQLLRNTTRSNKIIVMIGHSFLFDSGFIKLKSLLKKKIIGNIYFATYFLGQYLPDWHPKANYKIEYSARRELGGGALLTLTSHTFYVIESLFGKIKSIHGSIVDKISKLDINVDDSVFIQMKTEQNIIVQAQNNFILRNHTHKIIIEGEKGRLEYDFVERKIKILIVNKKSQVVKVDNGINSRYMKEMKYFLNALKRNSIDKNLNLDSGIRFLKIIKNL